MRSAGLPARKLKDHALSGEGHLIFLGSCERLRPILQSRQRVVTVERLVVEEHKPPRADGLAERDRVGDARMAPADSVAVLLL